MFPKLAEPVGCVLTAVEIRQEPVILTVVGAAGNTVFQHRLRFFRMLQLQKALCVGNERAAERGKILVIPGERF